MFNCLLDVVNSGVVGDVVAPDNIPDGHVEASGNNDLATGMLIGFCLALFLYAIVKLSIYLFKKGYYGKNNQEDD